jgi:uroporphyrin-III C-methyltransferase
MYVYLIGAGPGDPGLLTCKGRKVLSEADVVVYDYLASDELLSIARPDAEFIYVGKIAGNHAMKQGDINKLLVAKAKEGKVVARLKGGDPYIFGRGGEEAEELVDAGVPFEEVPGISSSIAGPAYAGIPLTHRAFSSSVTIITGHEDPTKPDSVHNWDALARSASTLVFLMGMKNLPDIASKLIGAGMSPETPAALVHWGTTDKQRSLASTLADLPDAAVREGFTNPSIIVVGDVVKLRDRLGWFEKKPLFGRTVVVTRAREQASDSAKLFAERYLKRIAPEGVELRMIAGNHEQYGEKLWNELTGYQRRDHLVIGNILFILTDTFGGDLDPTEHSDGTYCGANVADIKELMAKYPDKKVILCAHWFDVNLESPEFLELLRTEERILCLFCGHNHRSRVSSTGDENGNKAIIGTGNYSYSGEPNNVRCLPGYRVLEIDGERLSCKYVVQSHTFKIGDVRFTTEYTEQDTIELTL